jgi:DNA-binding NtrC family response regulator
MVAAERYSQSQASRALEARRAVSVAGETPGYWLLDSPGLCEVLDTARRLAHAPGSPVLIEGERGAGVPELARLIHDTDPIARMERLREIPAGLVSPSEMRGWGGVGTVFIEDIENLGLEGQDWVGEMLANRSQAAQPLRIIGGSRLSAKELSERKGFSQELLYAWDVGRLVIPPLRLRAGDILRLARRFLRHYAEWQGGRSLRFSGAAKRKLLLHSYPGNARELRSIVERAAALTASEEVGEDAIVVFDEAGRATTVRAALLRPVTSAAGQGNSHFPSLVELERDYLVMLAREFGGRSMAMSRTMGVSYATMRRKILRHGLDVRAIIDAATTSVASTG